MEAEERYSDEILDTFIELIDYLTDKEKLGLYDVKDLSGFCRLIIAHSSKIPKAITYVDQILKIQIELRDK